MFKKAFYFTKSTILHANIFILIYTIHLLYKYRIHVSENICQIHYFKVKIKFINKLTYIEKKK